MAQELPTPLNEHRIASQAELDARYPAAQAGDHLVLADGTYTLGTADRNGTEENPIVVRAENQLGAVLDSVDSVLKVTGDDQQFVGLRLADRCRVELRGARNRLHRCALRYAGGSGVHVHVSARQAVVEYCDIDGRFVQPDSPTWAGIRVEVRENAQHRIRRNWLHDCVQNQSDRFDNSAILAGYARKTSRIRTGNLYEHNLIEDWQGNAETIGVKESGATLRFNTLRRCKLFVNRHGKDNRWHGNLSEDSGGFRFHDGLHELLGNVIGTNGGEIRLYCGDVDAAGWPDNFVRGSGRVHPNALDCVAAGNVGPLIVGDSFDHVDNFDFPCRNILVEAHEHEGDVVKRPPKNGKTMQTGTDVQPTTARSIPAAQPLAAQPRAAARVGPNVGPDAPWAG